MFPPFYLKAPMLFYFSHLTSVRKSQRSKSNVWWKAHCSGDPTQNCTSHRVLSFHPGPASKLRSTASYAFALCYALSVLLLWLNTDWSLECIKATRKIVRINRMLRYGKGCRNLKFFRKVNFFFYLSDFLK